MNTPPGGDAFRESYLKAKMISQTISIVEYEWSVSILNQGLSWSPIWHPFFSGVFFDLESIGGFVAGGESLQAGAKGREGLVLPR